MTTLRKIYLIAGLFFLALILAVALSVLPIIRQINASSHELAQKKLETESFFSNWQNLENSKTDYQIIKNSLEASPIFLPADDAIEFIKALETIAQQTQNSQTISVIKNSDPTKKTAESLDFEISLWGTFPNLIKFLIYLENSQYYSNISSINITRNETTDAAKANAEEINTLIILSAYQQNGQSK